MPPEASSPAVSERMSRQASRDTAQEVAVRSLLHRRGLRFRKHVAIEGMRRRSMDIAFGPARVAVFLDGCFWHGCPDHATQPKANADWWRNKLDTNVARDRETTAHLVDCGWTVLRFWEHESSESIAARVAGEVRARAEAGTGRRTR